MKKIVLLFHLLTIVSLSSMAQLSVYQFFTAKGERVDFQQVTNGLKGYHVIFFGELHNDPISHWLQLQLAEELYEEYADQLILGAEMFESDDQMILTEYLNGIIRKKDLEKEAKLWPNYETDYRPLVDLAKENDLAFVATNIPRRYASLVAREGFEGLDNLSDDALNWVAPLPVEYNPELPGYQRMMKMSHMPGMKKKANENLPKAQAIKDATMAYFIVQSMSPGNHFLHFNGTYHSNYKEGIIWYVNQYKPDLNIGSVATVKQSSLQELEEQHLDKADYILVVPSDMTTTY